MNRLLLLVIVSCGVFSLAPLLLAEESQLDPKQAIQAERSEPVTYQVDFSAVVTPPYHTKTLKVWLPLPQTEEGQQVSHSQLTSFPMEVQPQIRQEPVFGNRFAYFEFDHPQGAQIIRHRFQVRVWQLDWKLNPAAVQTVEEWPESFQPYLRGEEQAVVVNADLTSLLHQIVPEPKKNYGDLTTVMSWVDSNFTYDHAQASLQASSLHGLQEKRGHCSDYHGFCAAMGRALGYPTRVTYGLHPMPKNSPSHCKLEAFLPPYGWVSFDVSETQKLAALIRQEKSLAPAEREKLVAAAVQRLRRGFRDNTWIKLTHGTDYHLAPPAQKKVSVVRTIYAEADGVALPEPDPSDPKRREFSWMTIHKYEADREVPYPFRDWGALKSNTHRMPIDR